MAKNENASERQIYEKIQKQDLSAIVRFPNLQTEIPKLIVRIKEIHARVIFPLKDINLYDSVQTNLHKDELKNLYDAEPQIIEMLRPIFSKSELQHLHINIESVKYEILDALYYLGLIYLKKDDYFNHYVKAAAIFQYCDQLSNKFNNSDYLLKIDSSGLTFSDRACLVERDFLISKGKVVPETAVFIEKNFKLLKKHKDELLDFRTQIKPELQYIESLGIKDIKERTVKVRELYNKCISFFVDHSGKKQGLIQKLIDESIDQLGSPPEGSQYAIIGFGSLAIGAMTLWSDLEFGIFINDLKNQEKQRELKKYFRDLTKLLWIKVVNFGETPLSSVGVEALNNFKIDNAEHNWFQDNIINKAFRFDSMRIDSCKSALGRQGNYQVRGIFKPDYELIMTPQEMVEFQIEAPNKLQKEENYESYPPDLSNWFYEERHLLQTLYTVILIDGSQELLDIYRNMLKRFRSDNAEMVKKRSEQSLLASIQEFSLRLDDNGGGELFNVKTTIYRLGERIVNELANYHGIIAEDGDPAITVWQMIDQMEQKRLLSLEGAQHLREAISIAAGLRLSAYNQSQGRYDNISTYEPVVTKYFTEQQTKELVSKIFYIEDTTILHHFYYVMVRVQNIIFNACSLGIEKHSKLILANDNLYSDNKLIKALVHARFLEYASAKKYMDEIRQNKPNELFVLHNLFTLYNRIGDLDNSCAVAELALKISNNNPDIILSYENLAKVYFAKKEYRKSSNYYNKLLTIKMQSELSPENELPPAIQMDIACIYDNIGHILFAQGRYKVAILFYEWSLEIKIDHCQEQSSLYKISQSYTNIARAYSYSGDNAKSITYYKKSLEIIRSYAKDDNDPDIAMNYDNLGDLYLSIGDHINALEYYKLALKIKMVIYKNNPNHTNIANSYDKLGDVYFGAGKYDQAEDHYFQSLLITTAIYGDDFYHPDIIKCHNKLGEVYLKIGEIDLALVCYSESFMLQTQTYEEKSDHPNIIRYFNGLENPHSNQGKYPFNIRMKLSDLSPSNNPFMYQYIILHTAGQVTGCDSQILDIITTGNTDELSA